MENWDSDSLKKVQLTLSQGKKKKGDEVADYKDNDAVRISVSQDRVTATLCTEELFSALSIYSYPCISDAQPCGGGVGREDTDGQRETFCGPS